MLKVSPQASAQVGVTGLRLLWFGYALLVLWMLTYPFALEQAGVDKPFLGEVEIHKINTLSNILVFVPLGVMGALLARLRGRSLALAVVRMTITAGLMSLVVEWVQIGLEQRASSLIDLIANTLGGTIGAIVGNVMATPLTTRWSAFARWFGSRPVARAALLVGCVITVARLAPFDLSMETHYLNPAHWDVFDAGHPLADIMQWWGDGTGDAAISTEARLEALQAITSLVLFTAGAFVLARAFRETWSRRGDHASPWLAVGVVAVAFIIVTELAQLIVRSRMVDTTEPTFALVGVTLGVAADNIKGRRAITA